MLIVLNRNANGGKALYKWKQVKKELDKYELKYELLETNSYKEMCEQLEIKFHQNQIKTLIAAGGDGTVNGLLNFIMYKNFIHKDLEFGAIGLGSSNDFHKPFSNERKIAGYPVILPTHSVNKYWDLGLGEYLDENHKLNTRYFVINSSIGLTANGNSFFNRDSKFLKVLKKIHLEVANAWTIMNVLKDFQTYKIHLKGKNVLNNEEIDREIITCNLGILKKRNVSGGMSYDTQVECDDGFLDLVSCGNMSRLEILKVVAGLYQGKFLGTPKTAYWKFSQLSLSSDRIFNLEFDGEVFRAQKVTFSVLNKALKIC